MSKNETDWGAATVKALNDALNAPRKTAEYFIWLEDIGPESWTPVAKADFERMKADFEGFRAERSANAATRNDVPPQ